MFNLSMDERLSAWSSHRTEIEESQSPLQAVWDFWKSAPFIPYNRAVDPHYQYSWPTPWQIIVDNHYDDFTKSLMIAKTLKLTKKFHKSQIEILIMVDNNKSRQYNIVCVDETWILNYNDTGPVLKTCIPESMLLENIIEVS